MAASLSGSFRSVDFTSLGRNQRELNAALKRAVPKRNLHGDPLGSNCDPHLLAKVDREMDKMSPFEGVDYWPPQNDFHDRTLREEDPDAHYWRKWAYCGLIGILAAILCFLMKQSIEGLTSRREAMVDSIVHGGLHEGGQHGEHSSHSAATPDPANATTPSPHGTAVTPSRSADTLGGSDSVITGLYITVAPSLGGIGINAGGWGPDGHATVSGGPFGLLGTPVSVGSTDCALLCRGGWAVVTPPGGRDLCTASDTTTTCGTLLHEGNLLLPPPAAASPPTGSTPSSWRVVHHNGQQQQQQPPLPTTPGLRGRLAEALSGSTPAHAPATLPAAAANGTRQGEQGGSSDPTHGTAAAAEVKRGKPSSDALWLAWFAWAGASCLFVAIAAGVIVFIDSRACGSGLPEVMAFLNGVQMSKALGKRVILIKFLSCLFAVASGLPVGPEGPMIHIGAMIGSLLTREPDYAVLGCGKSCVSQPALRNFRKARERRDFIACGAAAGVSAAFGAPLGGLLFVMEEVATHWNASLTWLIFFGCLTAFFFSTVFFTMLHGWVPTGHVFGSISPASQVLFQPELILASVEMHMASVIPAIIVGAACGLLAVYFTQFNLFVARWRSKVVKPRKWLRMLEPITLAFVYATVTFCTPLLVECSPMPEGDIVATHRLRLTSNETHHFEKTFVTFFCEDEGHFSPLASLTMNSGDAVIRHLFSHGTQTAFTAGSLIAFLLIYFVFAAYAAGCTYASGLVIPILVIGATTGRLVGVAVVAALPDSFLNWADPGVFALIGAASFFAGVSRLTVSLAVIMLELSNELYFLPVMMCGIMVAKWIGDYHSHSLYHSLMHMQGLPFLDPELSKSSHLQLHSAGDIATRPVVVVHEEEKVSTLLLLLRLHHNGFPVVGSPSQQQHPPPAGSPCGSDTPAFPDTRTQGPLKGILLRVQLEALLYARFVDNGLTLDDVERDHELSRELGEGVEPSRARREAKRKALLEDAYPNLTPEELGERVSLVGHYNRSPFVVQHGFKLQSAYEMFQSLGLRHLVVVTDAWRVCGIITRKDLIRIDERLSARNLLNHDTVSAHHRKKKALGHHDTQVLQPRSPSCQEDSFSYHPIGTPTASGRSRDFTEGRVERWQNDTSYVPEDTGSGALGSGPPTPMSGLVDTVRQAVTAPCPLTARLPRAPAAPRPQAKHAEALVSWGEVNALIRKEHCGVQESGSSSSSSLLGTQQRSASYVDTLRTRQAESTSRLLAVQSENETLRRQIEDAKRGSRQGSIPDADYLL